MFAIMFQRGLLRPVRRPWRDRFKFGAGRTTWKNLATLLPGRTRYVAIGLFVIAWIIGVTSIFNLGGQPQYDPATGRYYLNNHGSLIPVTHAGYVHAVALQSRLFLAGAIVFTFIATSVAWGEWRRRRQASMGRWPFPKRPRPRWVPPISGGLVMLALGLTVTSLLAFQIITRVNSYTADAVHLRPNGIATANLTPGDYVVFVGCTQSIACPDMSTADVVVRRKAGPVVNTRLDPSNDHLTFNAQPFVGFISFQVARPGTYIVATSDRGRPTLIAIHSPGQEAFSLIGWIAGTVLGLLFSLLGAICVLRWYLWRFGSPREHEQDSVNPLRIAPWPPPLVGG
jgi:hypothetical protein